MKVLIELTEEQISALSQAANAMLAGEEGAGDAEGLSFDVLETAVHALYIDKALTRDQHSYYFGRYYNPPVPKSMPKKETERLLSILVGVRNSATMASAAFPDNLKEETRLWRDSWIISPLDAIIDRYYNLVYGSERIRKCEKEI